MNRTCAGRGALPSAVGALVAVILTAPTPALAASAFDILVPKPAEFIPALVAFIVIWVILAKLVWPTVLKTLDARQQTIQNNLDAAEQAKVEAAEALKKAEAAVDKAQIQADDIVAEAKKTAEASRAAIIEKANADAKQIADRARENIDAERNAAMAELVDQAADLAVDLASKILGEHLDVETQKRLIEKSLAEAGDANVDE